MEFDVNKWAEETAQKIEKKLTASAKRNAHKIPYTAVNGVYDDMTEKNICWWTNGFWGGMMWQMYHATKNEMFCEIAQENEKKLDRNLMNYEGMDHDSGFKWLMTAIADYRLTGNKESKNRGLLAAANLAGRFNLAGNYIRAWNDQCTGTNQGWAIIDCMMNLPLLYWAYEQTKDPRFYHIAVAHANTSEKYFIRPDGSANHIVVFDAMTGKMLESLGGQGYEVGSSWTRGQAWALYGFVLSYIHTKEEAYLNTAKRIAHYFIANIPASGLIPVDFRQPADCHLEDGIAAAVASCGLLELEKCVPECEKSLFKNAALKMLYALEHDRSNWDCEADYILEKCTAAFHDKTHEYPIVYGDYYFVEAIWKLTGREIFLW